MIYAGKTRKEIAGYDDAFMRWVLCRRRDEYGALVRNDPDLPRWVSENLDSRGRWKVKNPQSYSQVFDRALEKQGLDQETRAAAWKAWRRENPQYGIGG